VFTVLFIRGVILLTHGKHLLVASFHEGRFVAHRKTKKGAVYDFDI
jgi:hypothetical protein